MDMNSMSFPPNDENIKMVRKFAREKGLSLRHVRNHDDLWDLIDPQTRECLLEHEILMFVHDYLCKFDI